MAVRQYTEEEHIAMAQKWAELFGLSEETSGAFKTHKYKGVTFSQLVPLEYLARLRDWKTREDDIFIVTYPKSGTHWIYEIVMLIAANGYPDKIDRSKMMKAPIEMRFPPDIVKPIYEALDTAESPRIVCTHLPWQFLPRQITEQTKGKIVYLMRNPKDVLASLNRYSLSNHGKQKDGELWEYFINTFLTGDVRCGSWFDHVEKFWDHRNQGNVFFTSYEQMKQQCKFEGVTFNKLSPPEIVAGVRDWKTRDDDIIISVYPKSGTHWMYEIVQLILADGYPEKINRSKMMRSTIEMGHPPEMVRPTYEALDSEESPRVMVSHAPWQFLPRQMTENKKGKIVYVMRNPKDVIASQNRFTLSNSKNEKDQELWTYLINIFLTGDVPFGSWFDHVEKYWQHRNQGNVFFASYENMKKNLKSVIRPLSKFLDHELDEDAVARVNEKSTVKAMKKTYDHIEKNVPGGDWMVKAFGKNPFIQKGVTGSWKELFTVAENELFDKVCKEKMASWDMDVVFE